MEPLISVIIPVYNTEQYLHDCVDSIIKQTYRDLQIILIDDGSTDGCRAICDQYAEADSRVNVIHKENEGAATARNTALKIVTGDYIAFVDSDDWLDTNLFEEVMRFAPFDVALFGCTYVDNKIGETREVIPCKHSSLITWADSAEFAERIVHNSLYGYACNKIYSKAVIGDITIPNVPLREDWLFNAAVFSRTRQLQLVAHPGYYYVQRDGSLLRGRYRGEVPDISSAAEKMFEIHPDLPKRINISLGNSVVKQYLLDAMYKFIFLNPAIADDEALKEIKKVFSDRIIFRNIHFSRRDSKLHFLLTLCIKLRSPELLYLLMKRIWHE